MSAIYGLGKQGIADGTIAWLTHNMVVVLLSSAYVVDLVSHQYLSDIGAGSRVATSGNLASKTDAAGVFDAADIVFTGVSSGLTITQFAIYRNTGVEATSPLMIYENSAANMPLVTDGTNLTLAWDNGASKIAAL